MLEEHQGASAALTYGLCRNLVWTPLVKLQPRLILLGFAVWAATSLLRALNGVLYCTVGSGSTHSNHTKALDSWQKYQLWHWEFIVYKLKQRWKISHQLAACFKMRAPFQMSFHWTLHLKDTLSASPSLTFLKLFSQCDLPNLRAPSGHHCQAAVLRKALSTELHVQDTLRGAEAHLSLCCSHSDEGNLFCWMRNNKLGHWGLWLC